MSYAGRSKYDEPGRAGRYRERSERRNREEWALVEELLRQIDPAPASAIDAPCGTGRIAEQLLGRGLAVTCADLSPAMRAETERRLEGKAGYGGVHALDLETGEGAPAPADLVVCLRFLHHLPDGETRARVWKTLRALTKGHVIVSFHHPVSAHNLSRLFRRLLTGKRGDRHTQRPSALSREAAAAGLRVVRFVPLARWRREFWVALLETDAGDPSTGEDL
ncbi:MAG: methyltransferase domain-containing protein [Planctomycetota bacterium]|nr:methyltransferase domain-containing protein [Planctomycetota bacterium]